MRNIPVALCSLVVSLVCSVPAERLPAQQRGAARPAQDRPSRIAPTHADVKYGVDPRNVLDLYLAKSETPTPLVVYIHGGGFRGGDKRSINQGLLRKLRAEGVSMAAFNYRLTQTAPFPAQMHDCARALQFLRHHAKKYNLDPKRVAATGGSAGSGISQWLAMHDDLARPDSEDPIARQSTRLVAAAPFNAQTSYDPRFIGKLFDTREIHPALLPFFGLKRAEDVADPRFHPLFVEASPIEHATRDDPPLLFHFSQRNTKLKPGSTGQQHIHHPKFGIVMKEKLDALGVECKVLFSEDHPGGLPVDEFVRFFLRHFAEPSGAEPPTRRRVF